MITAAQISFCEQTCRTASALGAKLRRYTKPFGPGAAKGFEWRLPDGRTLQGEAFIGLNEPRALHHACEVFAQHILS